MLSFLFSDLLAQKAGLIFSLALVVAVLIDFLWGEPDVRFHPVVWMGKYLQNMGQKIAPKSAEKSRQDQLKNFFLATLAWLMGAALTVAVAYMLQHVLFQWPWYVIACLLGVFMKPLFAASMLFKEVQAVETALRQSLYAGQQRLSYLCSRDVLQLNEAQVRETAIETLAENSNDSIVAPIFWFLLLGLPGIAVYRYANTADAMWGYKGLRSGRYWTWSGKFAARVDDVLSWIPARMTGLLIMVVGRVTDFKKLYQQAQITPSPNGGWPMGAMALALQVSLGKPGVYRLNNQADAPQSHHLQQALVLSKQVVYLAVLLSCISLLVYNASFKLLLSLIGLSL